MVRLPLGEIVRNKEQLLRMAKGGWKGTMLEANFFPIGAD